MKSLLEVKEFDSISCNPAFKNNPNVEFVEKENFDALRCFIEEYATSEENADVLDFMRIGVRRNVGTCISIRNYVGLIQMKSGFQIQILPKIDFGSEGEKQDETKVNGETKKIFLKMLRSMRDFPCKVFNEADLNIERMNLYEVFISMFVQEVRQLIKRGLKSGYIPQEDNLQYFKGKLLVSKHIRANWAHKEHFYVTYDDFLPNRPENRLIKATLEKLQKITTNTRNSRNILQLLGAFDVVDASVNHVHDFAQVVISRNTLEYDRLMQWAKVFLMERSFSTFTGSTAARSLLFPMESVFESYVTRQIKRDFCAREGNQIDWQVFSQDKSHYLFEKPKRFALRPDIVIRNKEKQYTIVMDTKWKRLVNDPRKNYGISQADMYQMYAYSKKYNASQIWLLYPKNEEMRGKDDICFDSGDGTTVRIHFVDVAKIETNIKELREKVENLAWFEIDSPFMTFAVSA